MIILIVRQIAIILIDVTSEDDVLNASVVLSEFVDDEVDNVVAVVASFSSNHF